MEHRQPKKVALEHQKAVNKSRPHRPSSEKNTHEGGYLITIGASTALSAEQERGYYYLYRKAEAAWHPRRKSAGWLRFARAFRIPPVKHVIEALDLTAEALAEGRPVPAQAVNLMTKNPFAWMPFALYRWIYTRFGGKGFEKEAAKNGVSRERLLDQPYAA